jgi:hypothetical protein
MKTFRKILLILLAVIAAMYLSLYVGFRVFGKAVIISQIEKNLKLKADIQSVALSFPLSARINKLDIDGLVKADIISINPSILGLLAGKIVLSELKIVNPDITIVKDAEGKLNLAQFEQKGRMPFFLAGLTIENGRLVFIDKKIAPEGAQIMVKDITARISKAAFPPTSLFTKFNISASLTGNDNRPSGSALASGWIDFRSKDMDGVIALKDISAGALSAYFQNIVPDKKLLTAKLNFRADLKAKNNDLRAKCHLEFLNLVPVKQPESVEVVAQILNLFSDESGTIAFDFTINTKLDKPKIDVVSLKGSIGKAAVQNIANQPQEEVAEKVKNTVKEFEELGKELKDIFKKKEE